jgi:alpha-L-fucosidase
MSDRLDYATSILPSPRQLAWQRLEFYGFVHFGVNTFTGREWGDGSESPSLFRPTALDAGQWASVAREAGMRGLILTCKHHDGFCLWPSRHTDHSVAASPWRDGRGDVVGELAEACRREDLRFGVYLSPWDRHEKSYGEGVAYDDFFTAQLEELCTGYGELFCIWFDGACGEGANGRRQSYDWDRYYEVVRALQPSAVISVCGPDVRWCGNEAGHCRTSEFSVVPALLRDLEKIRERSQKEDDRAFSRRVGTSDEDLGSRAVIADAGELAWYPAEVNTSIRPGWFYHPDEDGKVRALQELQAIYDGSVGGNACFLLNLPPDQRGLIHEVDAGRMCDFGNALRSRFARNLAANGRASADVPSVAGHEPSRSLAERLDDWWQPAGPIERATLQIDLAESSELDTVVLQEAIQIGQRVESFSIEVLDQYGWDVAHRGTVIGHKRISSFPRRCVRSMRIRFEGVRGFPTLALAGAYQGGPWKSLPHFSANERLVARPRTLQTVGFF